MRLIRAASAGSASRALTRCSRSLGSSNRYFGVSRQLLKSSLNRNAGALCLGWMSLGVASRPNAYLRCRIRSTIAGSRW